MADKTKPEFFEDGEEDGVDADIPLQPSTGGGDTAVAGAGDSQQPSSKGKQIIKACISAIVGMGKRMLPIVRNMRSPAEFFRFSNFSKPKGISDAFARARTNLRFFASNYAIVMLAITMLNILFSLTAVFGIVLVLTLWYLLRTREPGPLRVSTYEFSSIQQHIILVIFSLITLSFTGAWSFVFFNAFCALSITFTHAMLYEPAAETMFQEPVDGSTSLHSAFFAGLSSREEGSGSEAGAEGDVEKGESGGNGANMAANMIGNALKGVEVDAIASRVSGLLKL
uniref:PRA1 family protein n=1 Tax=Palpitomonas bilix TaxID=652834 RepID=A0A7S3DF85_9EUKA|mmetsp:Transcript_35186/g.91287  ORF Transcript_35186/g.91287 Transcript_35186/m.91287 type:complete len:283 (+) Transcript_35186:34-882(+)